MASERNEPSYPVTSLTERPGGVGGGHSRFPAAGRGGCEGCPGAWDREERLCGEGAALRCRAAHGVQVRRGAQAAGERKSEPRRGARRGRRGALPGSWKGTSA